ncbi:MAG: hypothetical protein LBF61_12510 [Azoarcus sp.]|nr:hypothetical protein [Azoarcus sp.]
MTCLACVVAALAAVLAAVVVVVLCAHLLPCAVRHAAAAPRDARGLDRAVAQEGRSRCGRRC